MRVQSPRLGSGDPLQHSCLENSMDREVWGLQSMGLQRDTTEYTYIHVYIYIYTHIGMYIWMYIYTDIHIYMEKEMATHSSIPAW